jgi:flavin reductase (DIM6/NTAB) family NADH-FMN oxidoreductase RutF
MRRHFLRTARPWKRKTLMQKESVKKIVRSPEKVILKPGTMLYPLPAVMVSCGSRVEEYNIITIAWTGIVCSDPPMCSISVRPERHSYAIIQKEREFVINLTTAVLAKATDWCGVRSGADGDKFRQMRLTPGPAAQVKAPLIMEAPVNLECRVHNIMHLGSHDMFLSEIVAVHADRRYLDARSGAFDLARAVPLVYCHGNYYTLGACIGKFGFSVQKKPGRRTRRRQNT